MLSSEAGDAKAVVASPCQSRIQQFIHASTSSTVFPKSGCRVNKLIRLTGQDMTLADSRMSLIRCKLRAFAEANPCFANVVQS
jgi:hypothetical protein